VVCVCVTLQAHKSIRACCLKHATLQQSFEYFCMVSGSGSQLLQVRTRRTLRLFVDLHRSTTKCNAAVLQTHTGVVKKWVAPGTLWHRTTSCFNFSLFCLPFPLILLLMAYSSRAWPCPRCGASPPAQKLFSTQKKDQCSEVSGLPPPNVTTN